MKRLGLYIGLLFILSVIITGVITPYTTNPIRELYTRVYSIEYDNIQKNARTTFTYKTEITYDFWNMNNETFYYNSQSNNFSGVCMFVLNIWSSQSLLLNQCVLNDFDFAIFHPGSTSFSYSDEFTIINNTYINSQPKTIFRYELIPQVGNSINTNFSMSYQASIELNNDSTTVFLSEYPDNWGSFSNKTGLIFSTKISDLQLSSTISQEDLNTQIFFDVGASMIKRINETVQVTSSIGCLKYIKIEGYIETDLQYTLNEYICELESNTGSISKTYSREVFHVAITILGILESIQNAKLKFSLQMGQLDKNTFYGYLDIVEGKMIFTYEYSVYFWIPPLN